MDDTPGHKEMEIAIKITKTGKSAGPDGLAADFYQRRGSVFVEDVTKVIHCIWDSNLQKKR